MQLFDFYEIVVFTSESAMSGNSLLTALDPNQLVLYKLYRDSTTYIDGHHVKVRRLPEKYLVCLFSHTRA